MYNAYILETVVQMRKDEAERLAATHSSRTVGLTAKRRRRVRSVGLRLPLRRPTA